MSDPPHPYYQWDAQDYARNSSQQKVWAFELIQHLNLSGDETILDVGCGDGKITAEIAARLPNGSVTGIDISEDMVRLARQSYPPETFTNLHFQQEDANRLPFVAKFTTVFSNATLHWLRDPRPALQGIGRSLKPGGRILLQMGGTGNAAEIIRLLDRQIQSSQWAPYFDNFNFPYGFYSPVEYLPWLQEGHLTPVRVELVPKDMVHPGPDGLTGWLRTTWHPYTQQVPPAQREAFLTELVNTYLKEHPLDEQGRTHVQMVRLEVEAIKI
jgi:trans-aconitate 2-methyltransferase